MLNQIISVIIPVHNRIPLADESVQSVYDQSYRPIELIIVDDLSDENYHPKISSQPGFDIIVIRHEENRGPGASRETGRLSATGDYIAYLDSDDLWHPEKLEKQVKMLQDNPEAGMCYCTSAEFSQLPLTGQENIRKRSDQEYTEFLPAVLHGRPWGTGACLWTKKASDIIGPWFPGWIWEDYEYDIKAGCYGIKICFLQDALSFYRKGSGFEKLSDTDWNSRALKKSDTLFAINSKLEEFNKYNDEVIRRLFFQIIYHQSVHLFYLNQMLMGAKFLNIIQKYSQGGKKIFVNFCLILTRFLSPKFIADLLYRSRNFFN